MAASRLITAAICTYNRYDLLEGAVQSLLDQTLDQDSYEILVVDNSPAGEQGEALAARYADHACVRYLSESTPGLSNARNVALHQARAPFVAFMDDDAVAQASWLEEILQAFGTFGDEAGAVGGKVCPIWLSPRPAWFPDDLLGTLSVVDWGGGLRPAGPTEWVAGANFSVRVEAALAVGGFATSLGRVGQRVLLSNEDVRMTRLLQDRGLKIIWAPDAVVDHNIDPRRLEQHWLRSRMAWQAVSDLLDDAEAPERDVAPLWRGVTGFISKLPPAQRTPRGLFSEMQDPLLCSEQVRAVYSMAMLFMLGHHLADE